MIYNTKYFQDFLVFEIELTKIENCDKIKVRFNVR